MQLKHISPFLIPLLIIPITSSACFSSWQNSSKDHASHAVNRVLEENGLDVSNVKNTLNYEYDETVKKITKLLEKFLEKAKKFVYKVDLKEYVKSLVNKKLQLNGILPNRIPAAIISEYNQKCKTIMKEIKDKMWFNNTNYITRDEIEMIVDSEIDSYFIQKIKHESNNATTWGAFDAISDAWTNIFGSEQNSSSNYTPSKPDYIYFTPPYNCSICSHTYQTDERIGVLSCGHCFHSSCIKSWLSNQKTCPICNQSGVFLAKIYDSKEKVPGYLTGYSDSTTTYPTPSAPDYPTIVEPTPSAPTYEEPSAPAHIYYDPKCAICLDEYKSFERIGVLSCGHTFHSSCVKEWLKNANTCPMCRKENPIIAKIYDDKDQVPK